jgi:hypothetical protein
MSSVLAGFALRLPPFFLPPPFAAPLDCAGPDDGGGDAKVCFPNIAAITLTLSVAMRCVASGANYHWELDNAFNECMVSVEVCESLASDLTHNGDNWWRNRV